MRTITYNELSTEYLFCKTLSSEKKNKTYMALKEHSDGSIYPVVVKEIDEKRAQIYQTLTAMWNPFLADTYEVIHIADSEYNYYAAITEYVYADGSSEEESISLAEFIQKNSVLSEAAALSICVQICEGLKEFHKKGFVHRDLKPENIMISRYDIKHPQIKIIDFGGTAQLRPSRSIDTTIIGTLGYQAPESIVTRSTKKSDIYSIGCILNYLLTGQLSVIKEYTNNHYITSIIERATNEDPSHRYADVVALQKELEHELRIHPIDRIPVLRLLPGFRTHTLWKKVVGILSYICILFIIVDIPKMLGIVGLIEILTFYVFVPMIILFNMGNLLRFFPKSLRQNNRLFFMIRTFIMMVSLFAPIIVDYFMGRGTI